MAHWTRLALISLLVTGCSPATLTVDAGGDDDDIDAAAADASSGTVTVVVLEVDTAEPQAGVNVGFFEQDGTLVAVHVTDGDGRAQETVNLHAMVAIGRVFGPPGDTEYRIEVVAGVQPGETIEMGPLAAERDGMQLGTARCRVPSTFGGASNYVAGSCSLDTVTPGVEFTHNFRNDDCTRGATTQDLLAIAEDIDRNPLAYATIPGVLNNSPSLFLAGTWNTDFNLVNVALLDAPFATTVDLSARIYRNSVEYRYSGLDPSVPDIAVDGNANVDLRFPPNFADRVNLEVQLQSTASDRLLAWATNRAATAGSQTLNLTTDMLPLVDQNTLDQTAPERPEFGFRINGTAPDATAQIHLLFMSTSAGDARYLVLVGAPPDGPSPFRMPALPADFVVSPIDGDGGTASPAWPPPSGSTVDQYFSGLYEASFIADYTAFRTARGLGVLFGGQFVSRDLPVGATARVSVGGSLFNN